MRKLEVRKGEHRADQPLFFSGFKISKRIKLTYRFRFSTSMWDDPELLGTDMHDINKLFGTSLSVLPYFLNRKPFFKPPHQRRSARFGYRCTDEENVFELLAYCYDKKQRMKHVKIGTWKAGEMIELRLETFNNKVLFTFVNISTQVCESYMERLSNSWFNVIPRLHYFLSYYHGGNKPKPSDGTFYSERVSS